jgi:hypothetical protein
LRRRFHRWPPAARQTDLFQTMRGNVGQPVIGGPEAGRAFPLHLREGRFEAPKIFGGVSLEANTGHMDIARVGGHLKLFRYIQENVVICEILAHTLKPDPANVNSAIAAKQIFSLLNCCNLLAKPA